MQTPLNYMGHSASLLASIEMCDSAMEIRRVAFQLKGGQGMPPFLARLVIASSVVAGRTFIGD